jgi:DNA-binding transcriptional regulator GbsR (MarR family)
LLQLRLGGHRRRNLDFATELCDISVMTETPITQDPLPKGIERFVLHWGEMGSAWGVNRSIGQIHALLYLAEAPLTAEDVAGRLGLARSNVSNSLRDLVQWGLVRRTSVLGDRRDYYEAEADLWEMVMRIAEMRKARELDPTIAVLHLCRDEAAADRQTPAVARQRIESMLAFVDMLDRWADDMRRVPRSKLAALVKLGSRVLRLLPGAGGRRRSSEPSST